MSDERNPPFNMAVATLMRLDKILKDIKNLHLYSPGNSVAKQSLHLNLVKEFYNNAVPLLDNEAPLFEDEVKNLKMERKFAVSGGNQRYTEIFDEDLDYRLNKLIRDIQIKLKKFFMPSSSKEMF